MSSPKLNPFEDAPVIAKTNSPSKKKGKERPCVELGDKLDKLAAFKVLEKLLENEAAILNAEVREEVIGKFASDAHEIGRKPDSFVGVGSRSRASCEIRKRGSNMPLSPEVVEQLEQLGIPYSKQVKVEERFVLNPALDQATLGYLAEVIKKDPKLKGKQIIMKQNEEYINTVSDDTIDQMAKKVSVDTMRVLLEKVATFAIGKYSFDGNNIEDGDKQVTTEAKSIALSILQEMGVLPAPAPAVDKKKKA